MLLVIALSILATGVAGLFIKWLLEFRESEARISWREYAIGMACSPILAFLIAWAGWSMARSSNMTFSEYLNGWEIAAVKSYTQCSRDGPCRWEYDCDPYIVMVPYSCNCDKDGCSTCYRPETRYHSCPYVNMEYDYTAQTTLGEFSIARNVFPVNPQSHRWRKSTTIPDYIITSAGVGDPPFWTAAKQRCDANAPGPVTKKHNYPNYILASERTLMKQYSSDIEEYKKENLLPDLPKDTHSFYRANKIRFIGFSPPNAAIWQESLEYLNAALGSQLNGDLMLVAIKNANVASNPERYALALKAFWQDKTTNKEMALPKNTIVVVLGTDDEKTISWSRGFTAMPIGNEGLTVALRDGLRGISLNPEVLIGPTRSSRKAGIAKYPPDDAQAVLPKLLWGLDNPSTKFSRISMSGKDGKGGFLYLKGEIELSSGQIWAIFIGIFLVSMCVWIWTGIHYDPSERTSSFTRIFRKM